MSSAIDMRAIIIANVMGLTILLSVARGHYWRLKSPSSENRIMVIMFFACFLSCVMDPICFWADGKAGFINTLLIWVSNTWLYIANTVMALCFHALVSVHLGIQLYRIHKILLSVPAVVVYALMTVNLFVPIVFSVENNVYQRTALYWVILAADLLICLDGLLLYWYVKRSSGMMKFFPAASFVVPAAIGIFIQTVWYGVSTFFPFYAVSFGCIATALQNELIFRDQLTGLYNRFFFGTLEKRLSKTSDGEYTAMMLDVNDFKSLNDTYGHNVGDKALIEVAEVLRDVVRENGIAIRYAGDEFIIILFDTVRRNSDAVVESIHAAFEQFNSISGNPYKLSVSIGHCKVSLKKQSLNAMVDKIDKLMYEDKHKYYTHNSQHDRRK